MTNDYTLTISSLIALLNTLLNSKDTATKASRLVFMKYCVDNYIGVNSIREIKVFDIAKNLSQCSESQDFEEIVTQVMECVDKAFSLNNILASEGNIRETSSLLSGDIVSDGKCKANIKKEDFKKVTEFVDSLTLTESASDHTIGKALSSALTEYINLENKHNAINRYETESNTANTVKNTLCITSEDTYLSAHSNVPLFLEVLGDNQPKIVYYNQHPLHNALAASFLIMMGFADFTITDSIDHLEITATKIYWDDRNDTEGNYSVSSSVVKRVDNILSNYLSPDTGSIAIITIPNALLYRTNEQIAEQRKQLLASDLLAAVITVPSKSKTSTGKNLAIFARSKNGLPIKNYRTYLGKDKIAKSIKGEHITFDEFKDNGYSLVASTSSPSTDTHTTVSTISIEEIDKKLRKLYAEFGIQ